MKQGTHSDVYLFISGKAGVTLLVWLEFPRWMKTQQSRLLATQVGNINLCDSHILCWEKFFLLQQMLTDLPQYLKGRGAEKFTLVWHQLRASAPLNVQQMKKLKKCVSQFYEEIILFSSVSPSQFVSFLLVLKVSPFFLATFCILIPFYECCLYLSIIVT